MIVVRRHDAPLERYEHAIAAGFDSIERITEHVMRPNATHRLRLRRDVEIITYVEAGSLAYEDSIGRSGVIQAGEFHYMTVKRRARHNEINATRTDTARVFHIWLRASNENLPAEHAQKRFSVAERRGVWREIASPEPGDSRLKIHRDLCLYSTILEPGRHLVHELALGRVAWLYVVSGEVTLDGVVLVAGDGAGLTDERAVSLTATQKSELLLLDLAPAFRAPS